MKNNFSTTAFKKDYVYLNIWSCFNKQWKLHQDFFLALMTSLGCWLTPANVEYDGASSERSDIKESPSFGVAWLFIDNYKYLKDLQNYGPFFVILQLLLQ